MRKNIEQTKEFGVCMQKLANRNARSHNECVFHPTVKLSDYVNNQSTDFIHVFALPIKQTIYWRFSSLFKGMGNGCTSSVS